MDRTRAGNARSMHQLGYELPERTGFGGLWEAVADAAEHAQPTLGALESAPEVVARCDGATSPRARVALEAFRRCCCEVEPDVEAAA